jgi:tRNA (guanine37-N1)-methyltransferase
MVMKVDPIFKCVEEIKSKVASSKLVRLGRKSRMLILLTSAKGEIYNQQKAELIKNDYTDIIIICGRYEGVDERVAEFIADEEVSIGKYVLTGGELPAMLIVDSVTRLLDGVLGNGESLLSESHNVKECNKNQGQDNFDYPVYTRPIEFNGWKVPDVLLGGNHKEIEEWRHKMQIKK